MKGILNLLKRRTAPLSSEESTDSVMFTTAFAEIGVEGSVLIPWDARANEIDAKRLSTSRGLELMHGIWDADRYMSRLDAALVARLSQFFDFATVPADREIIGQNEYGNFMVVLLSGSIAVDRNQPWGEVLRLAVAQPGDILGEMSLLDSGLRFSKCTSLNECQIAVLAAKELDEMMTTDPLLAANLIALLARKLSTRLRVVGTRLSEVRTSVQHDKTAPHIVPA
jgi:CRP/FNR family transcriptional regulator, cyclic AMP receptor protein